MEYFEKVKIPVFGSDASSVSQFTVPSEQQVSGTYFTDDAWLSGTNYTRIGGVVEGIARSIDYNTVMRQCSTMASLLANILAYRNSLSNNPYGDNGADTIIGTDPLSNIGETSIDDHIRGLTSIFSGEKFLLNNEVTTRTLATGAVTTQKLSNGAVTTDKVSNDQITQSKLADGLVYTGSATSNGITVSLSQRGEAGNRGFVIGVNSSKVTNSTNSDNSTNAQNLNTERLTSNVNIYLCGVQSNDTASVKPVYHTSSVYVSNLGQLNATDFNVMSDERLKENIVSVGKHQVKDLVEHTDVKLYNYKDTPNHTTVGLIAQDIQRSNSPLSDLLVFKDGEYFGIHEDKLIYVLWNYAQQLNQRVANLERTIKELNLKK